MDSTGLADVLLGIRDNREVFQPEEVHFKQAQILDRSLWVLGGEVTVLQGHRNQICQALVSDNNPACVLSGVANHRFNDQPLIDDLFRDRVDLDLLLQVFAFGDRIVE